MKRALIFQHMNHDHLGRILDFMVEDGIVPDVVRIWEGQPIPKVDGYDLMISMGGPQDTWQKAENPWIVEEMAAIEDWVGSRAKPFLGICLGYQLMAEALGGEVGRVAEPEVGMFEIELTDAGAAHPFMAGIAPVSTVPQFHQAEVKRLPAGGVVLASSPRTTAQAVAIDTHALGLQFHCEHTAQTYVGWASAPNVLAYLERERGKGAYERMLSEAWPAMPGVNAFARSLYDNFVRASGLIT